MARRPSLNMHIKADFSAVVLFCFHFLFLSFFFCISRLWTNMSLKSINLTDLFNKIFQEEEGVIEDICTEIRRQPPGTWYPKAGWASS